MNRSGKTLCCVGLGVALAAAAVWLAYFRHPSIASDFVFLPEVCTAGLAAVLLCLLARETSNRERAFWLLWAAGCALWVAGIVSGMLAWPLRAEMDFPGLAFTFLPGVAMMAALVMRPELGDGKLSDPVARFEAALVALWWVYLYLLFVTPWHWIAPDLGRLWTSFVALHYFQDFMLVVWLAALASHCRGRWRRIYGQMACAMALVTVTVGPLHHVLGQRRWEPAMALDAAVAVAFLWLAFVPLIAGRGSDSAPASQSNPESASGRGNLVVSITMLGVPVLMLWSRFISDGPDPVARFRLLVSFATLVVGVLLIYRWQEAADEHRESLVRELESSVLELRRLQGQFAEAEKLASLGQLAAGAAHEINNPVAAMLGFAELVHADAGASPHVRELGRKIGDQARRIRTLVHNLLSLGEYTALEVQPVDLAALVHSAIDLLRLNVRHRYSRLTVAIEQSPLETSGDPEKLLQVFYRLLLDLSGEEGEKGVELHARLDHPGGRAVVELIERSAAAAADLRARQPYDAQHAQQGGGLSLGVCYTIIQEHHGTITCENLPDGRRRFRVSLPAAAHGGAAGPAPSTAAQSC